MTIKETNFATTNRKESTPPFHNFVILYFMFEQKKIFKPTFLNPLAFILTTINHRQNCTRKCKPNPILYKSI